MVQGYKIDNITLSNEMRASTILQIFQYKEWVVLVDVINVFTGIQMDSSRGDTNYKTLVGLNGYNIR